MRQNGLKSLKDLKTIVGFFQVGSRVSRLNPSFHWELEKNFLVPSDISTCWRIRPKGISYDAGGFLSGILESQLTV